MMQIKWLEDMDIGVWFALMAPPDLPETIAAKLRQALTESLQAPEFRRKAKYQKIVDFAKIQE